MLDHRMPADRMPPSRGVTQLTDIPDGERRDGGPELVIRGEHPVVAMPVLARRRHEIGGPAEELKGQEVDDAVRPRPCGLSRVTQADPVGRPNGDSASRVHGVDLGDAAGWALDHAAPYPLGDRGQISLRDRS
jgi:hypothetical protein